MEHIALKLPLLLFSCTLLQRCLSPLSADSARELHVLGSDGDALGVDRRQVGVLEQAHEIRFACALERQDRLRLELEICLKVLRHLPHEALERPLPAQELRPFLVLADLAKRDSARPARPWASRFQRTHTCTHHHASKIHL